MTENQLSSQEFVDMQILRERMHFLSGLMSDFHWKAKKIVVEYIKNNLPKHNSDNYNVEFQWVQDGILVSYEHTAHGFGSWEDDRKSKLEVFSLKYQDVFGWDIDWQQKFNKGAANQIVLDFLK